MNSASTNFITLASARQMLTEHAFPESVDVRIFALGHDLYDQGLTANGYAPNFSNTAFLGPMRTDEYLPLIRQGLAMRALAHEIHPIPIRCSSVLNPRDETNVAMYLELKKGTLELPNHLEYLTEKIETERAKVADHSYHSGTRNSFNGLRVGIIRDTLCHLPSPATVRLLGHYLSDERDTPPPPFPGQDWGDSESNAYQACTALEQIGLRNAPVKARSVQNESNLATWRLWRGQVEAGTRAFSFEGEEVEYRFCKDGTWEQSAISNTTRKTSDSSSAITTHSVWSSYQARWACVVAGIFIGWLFLQWSKRRRLAV